MEAVLATNFRQDMRTSRSVGMFKCSKSHPYTEEPPYILSPARELKLNELCPHCSEVCYEVLTATIYTVLLSVCKNSGVTLYWKTFKQLSPEGEVVPVLKEVRRHK
jgi:hypothetical protein